MKHQKQGKEQLPFSEQLRQSIINQPYDLASLWGRAADSFPQNKRKQLKKETEYIQDKFNIGQIFLR